MCDTFFQDSQDCNRNTLPVHQSLTLAWYCLSMILPQHCALVEKYENHTCSAIYSYWRHELKEESNFTTLVYTRSEIAVMKCVSSADNDKRLKRLAELYPYVSQACQRKRETLCMSSQSSQSGACRDGSSEKLQHLHFHATVHYVHDSFAHDHQPRQSSS